MGATDVDDRIDEAGKVFDSRFAHRRRAIRVALFLSARRFLGLSRSTPIRNEPVKNRCRPASQRQAEGKAFSHRRLFGCGIALGHSSSTRVRCRIVHRNPRPMLDRHAEDLPCRGACDRPWCRPWSTSRPCRQQHRQSVGGLHLSVSYSVASQPEYSDTPRFNSTSTPRRS